MYTSAHAHTHTHTPQNKNAIKSFGKVLEILKKLLQEEGSTLSYHPVLPPFLNSTEEDWFYFKWISNLLELDVLSKHHLHFCHSMGKMPTPFSWTFLWNEVKARYRCQTLTRCFTMWRARDHRWGSVTDCSLCTCKVLSLTPSNTPKQTNKPENTMCTDRIPGESVTHEASWNHQPAPRRRPQFMERAFSNCLHSERSLNSILL